MIPCKKHVSPVIPEKWLSFKSEVRDLVNCLGIDSDLNVSDLIIAQFLTNSLASLGEYTRQRDFLNKEYPEGYVLVEPEKNPPPVPPEKGKP